MSIKRVKKKSLSEEDLRKLRRSYEGKAFKRSDLAETPVEQFRNWLEEARLHDVVDFTAMQLATASADGIPAVRTVLLKHYDDLGFCWYTNADSDKSVQMGSNPRAQLHFYWQRLNRQIRISGEVVRLPREDAEAYFHSRPVGSQIAAYVSRQSREIADRKVLEEAFKKSKEKLKGHKVPCPDDWCGYRLRPHRFEFWQGRRNRLHDRLVYYHGEKGWEISRLAP